MQSDVLTFGFLGQSLTQTAVGRHAAAAAERVEAGFSQRRKGLAHQAIDHRFLKTRGQIGDLLRGKLYCRQIGLARPDELDSGPPFSAR